MSTPNTIIPSIPPLQQSPSSLQNDTTPSVPSLGLQQSTSTQDIHVYDYVVGIDFGTTFSGCSYASTLEPIVKCVTDWPEGHSEEKARTSLLYNPTQKKFEQQWGQTAKRLLSKGNRLIENFKALLLYDLPELQQELEPDLIASYRELKESDGIEPEQILAEYLQRLTQHTLSQIKPRPGSVKYVLTVTSSWPDLVRGRLRRAAVRAGLAEREDQLEVVTESEASSICCGERAGYLKSLSHRFIVCDIGKSRLELATFQPVPVMVEGRIVNSYSRAGRINTGPGTNVLEKNFLKYVSEAFHEEFPKKHLLLDSLLEQFNELKRSFNKENNVLEFYMAASARKETNDMKFSLPVYFRKNISILEKSCKKGKIKDDQYIIPYGDIKVMFDEITLKIIQLAEEEIKKNGKNENEMIKKIILVGGFAMSKYVQTKINDWCEDNKIERPCIDNHIMTSISYGAALYGLKPYLIAKPTVKNQ